MGETHGLEVPVGEERGSCDVRVDNVRRGGILNKEGQQHAQKE